MFVLLPGTPGKPEFVGTENNELGFQLKWKTESYGRILEHKLLYKQVQVEHNVVFS